MIGSLILNECLNSSQVSTVTSFVRKKSNLKNLKLKEVLVDDFEDYSQLESEFSTIDVAFFCIGVYTGQVNDDLFKKITVDYAYQFALKVKEFSPNARLCLLSGQGADRTAKSQISFAKYKGMAETKITNLGLEFYAFRPSYIYPVIPRKEPNFMYRVFRKIYPIIKPILGKSGSIKSTELANAMVLIGIYGGNQEIYENKDIINLLQSSENI